MMHVEYYNIIYIGTYLATYIDLQNVQRFSFKKRVYCLMNHCGRTDMIEMFSWKIIEISYIAILNLKPLSI